MTATKAIYTIGHGARLIHEFVDCLKEASIQTLVDVRQFPGSRAHPHFGKEKLMRTLASAHIEYLHVLNLGGRRRKAKTISTLHTAIHVPAFCAYAEYMQTQPFAAGYAQLCDLARTKRVAFMCSETLWWRCHRRMISDKLVIDGWSVLHLGLGSTKTPPKAHPLWEIVRFDSTTGHLIYDQQGRAADKTITAASEKKRQPTNNKDNKSLTADRVDRQPEKSKTAADNDNKQSQAKAPPTDSRKRKRTTRTDSLREAEVKEKNLKISNADIDCCSHDDDIEPSAKRARLS